jgi:hypothetical protein
MTEDFQLVIAAEKKMTCPIFLKICNKEILTLQKIHVDLQKKKI